MYTPPGVSYLASDASWEPVFVPKGEFTGEQIDICGDNLECLYDL